MPCGAYVCYCNVMAVLPKSNTVTGVIGPVCGKNRFYVIDVFKPELLEICKFIWPNRIYPNKGLLYGVLAESKRETG